MAASMARYRAPITPRMAPMVPSAATSASRSPGTPSSRYTIWNGNWLNWNTSGGTIHQTRMEIIRDVTTNLLQDLNGVNVGLMHFNDNQGGPVSHAMEDIATARAAMQAAVNALTPGDWTPLSETLYEAANYYMGRNVDYGNVGPVRSVAASRTSGTISGTTYRRPATYACQKNYIVLLTDGLPTAGRQRHGQDQGAAELGRRRDACRPAA